MAIRRCYVSFLSHRRVSTAAAPTSAPPTSATIPSLKPTFLLRSSVRAESDPEKVLALFQSSTHLPSFYDDRRLYQLSVDKLARSKRPDLVERLLESQIADPNAPKYESFFIRIMSLYASASMPDHALRTFEQISSRTEQSFTALLTAYLREGRNDRVRELFDSVPVQHGIVPLVTPHNVLLDALCNAGEVHVARKVLDEMFDKKGLKPNIVSYNTVLAAYLKNEDEAGFNDILQEMDKKQVAHSIITYNLRIMHFCKLKESLKAEGLLDELISNGIQPNHATFSAIIKGFCKQGDTNSAIRVLNRMKMTEDPCAKKTFKPNPGIYRVLLSALVGEGDFTTALQICEERLDSNFAPPVNVMKALIHELVKDSKPEKAKVLFGKMRSIAKGCGMDSWSKIEALLPM